MTCPECASREERWQRVARTLRDEYVAMVSRAGYPNVDGTVADWMRLVGLVWNGEKWEFINA